MDRSQVKSVAIFRSWYQLSRAKDTAEKRLAFLDGILDYAFLGKEGDDPSTLASPCGADYARYDGYLTAKDAIDDEIGNRWRPRKVNPNMARWGNQNARKVTPIGGGDEARNASQSTDDTEAGKASEDGEKGESKKTQNANLRFDCETQKTQKNAKNAKTQNCVSGDSLFHSTSNNIYNNTRESVYGGCGGAFAPHSRSCDCDEGNIPAADSKPTTSNDIVTDSDGIDLRRILPSQEEMINYAHQINVPDTYLPTFIANMKDLGWGYVNRGGAYVQLNRRNFKSILRSFYEQHKKDNGNGNPRTVNSKNLRAQNYNEGLAAKKGF